MQPPFPSLRARLRPPRKPEEALAVDRYKRIIERFKAGGLGPDDDQRAYWQMQTEADLDRLIRSTALTLNYFPYHTAYSIKSESGFPDWVLVRPDRLIFAEAKREGDGPRPGRFNKRGRWQAGQEEWLARLWHASDEVYLWWPSDGADIATILLSGPRPEMPCVRRTAIVAEIGAETFPPKL